LFTDVTVNTEKDTTAGANSQLMVISIANKKKVKINKVYFIGLSAFSEKSLKRKMKGTKEKAFYKIFTNSEIY